MWLFSRKRYETIEVKELRSRDSYEVFQDLYPGHMILGRLVLDGEEYLLVAGDRTPYGCARYAGDYYIVSRGFTYEWVFPDGRSIYRKRDGRGRNGWQKLFM